MMQLEWAALGAAVVLSVVSIGDAILRATTDVVPPWDDESTTTWALVATNLMMAATFALLAAVLVRNAERIDAGSGGRRWTRRLLAVSLGILSLGFLLIRLVDSDVAGAVAGITFMAMFVIGGVLGATLLRRPEVRLPAVLMVAAIPLLGLLFVPGSLIGGWGHPGYAETALYVGIALLGTHYADARGVRPEQSFAGAPR